MQTKTGVSHLEFLLEYGMFLIKAATIVVAIIIVLGAILTSGSKNKNTEGRGSIKVTRLNDHLDEMRDVLRHSVLDKFQLKQLYKAEKKSSKAEQKELKEKVKRASAEAKVEAEAEGGNDSDNKEPDRKKRVYVLNFKGDIAAQAVTSLREEITAVLSLADSMDEVLLRLESPGGMVHAYGLASSQLLRIKNQKVPLTICVDKVAASGGYMMACLADRLVAAPFSIIGSIGVLVQLPNVHRALKKVDVDYEIISAGEYKTTMTTFGEITQKGRDKMQEDVETIHGLFKGWVKEHRPSVDIDKIATGETWVGMQAKERYMVDEIRTSDECIIKACETADVFEVEYEIRKSMIDTVGSMFQGVTQNLFSNWFEKSSNTNYQ